MLKVTHLVTDKTSKAPTGSLGLPSTSSSLYAYSPHVPTHGGKQEHWESQLRRSRACRMPVTTPWAPDGSRSWGLTDLCLAPAAKLSVLKSRPTQPEDIISYNMLEPRPLCRPQLHPQEGCLRKLHPFPRWPCSFSLVPILCSNGLSLLRVLHPFLAHGVSPRPFREVSSGRWESLR